MPFRKGRAGKVGTSRDGRVGTSRDGKVGTSRDGRVGTSRDARPGTPWASRDGSVPLAVPAAGMGDGSSGLCPALPVLGEDGGHRCVCVCGLCSLKRANVPSPPSLCAAGVLKG